MTRYLVLENGTVFTGEGFGADGDVIAEVVFTTAMTGFLETLTDPSYTGQAVVQTFPLIGNYGVIPEDAESGAVGVSAYIVRQWCEHPSNFRWQTDLDSYLKANGIVGLCGIDTRALTRTIREHGVMNGMITGCPEKADLAAIKAYRVTAPVAKVSTPKPILMPARERRYTVALLDYGMKANIPRSLVERGCDVHVLPWNASAQEVLALQPDGIFLSNGPGDPEENTEAIETLRALTGCGIPTMGICLGHQLLALAHGFRTHKLKYGHRGANHPVRCLQDSRVYISSQNHGYAVTPESIDPAVATALFENVNDLTNEGLLYLNEPTMSVQFHPEACGGPLDTGFLFDRFIEMMKEAKTSCR